MAVNKFNWGGIAINGEKEEKENQNPKVCTRPED